MSTTHLPLIFALLVMLCSCGNDTASKTAPAPSTVTAPAAAPTKAAATAEDFTFVPGKRFGKITAATKAEDMAALYGNDIVLTDEIHLGEGMMSSGYLLYAGTANRAEILLPNEEHGIENLKVTVMHKGGDWRMEGTGLHVGTTLAELHELNGKPFELTGYEWDYGGTVTDWKGGKLTGVGVVTAYDNLKFVGENADKSIFGDHTMSSENPALQPIGVTVARVIIDLK